jgi:hypothetical protein
MFRKFLCAGMSMIAAAGNLTPALAASALATQDKAPLAFVDVAPTGDYLGAGIESYAVAPRPDGGQEVIVVAQRGDFAHIQVVPGKDSTLVHGSVFDTGESVTVEVAGQTVVVYSGGVPIGGWTATDKGPMDQWGMQDIAANEAFGITLVALGELNSANDLGTGDPTNPPTTGIIIPVIIGGLLWCIQQCNLCDLYYRTCNPPCNNPPRACDHCFAWYCLD